MTKLIRRLVSAVCLALLSTSYSVSNSQVLDPTQVYNTGELTTFNQTGSNSTSAWQNVGQWGGSLSCWGPGGPGYCGPQPYVNANGYGMINFSYGYTDLHQVVNIANALPNSGTGLRVNGFNFGFTAKNGNGWDGGRQDYLAAYVNFYGANGSLTQSYDYSAYTNNTYNWTNFNFSETFLTPYATKDLSVAKYGFVGYDKNGWAGPYGPEIYNVSFSLKYSVDSCSMDVMSSPTCPGYLEALAKLNPVQTTTTEPIITTTSVGTTVTATPVLTTTETVNSPTITPTVSPIATVSSSPPSTTQTKVGEISVPGAQPQSSKSSGPSLSMIMGIVGAEQSRISNVEKTTVQQSVEQSIQSSNSAKDQAESVAASAQAQSISSSSQQSFGFNGSQIGFSPFSIFNSATQNRSSVGLQIGSVVQQQVFEVSYRPQLQQQNNQIEVPLTDKIRFGERGVIETAIETKPIEQSSSETNQGRLVKNNVSDNEVSGGVSIASIAKQPIGYESYFGTLVDRPFYAPKEIYKNQKVVDNVRVLRNLTGGSDSLHQQMMDSQYNK